MRKEKEHKMALFPGSFDPITLGHFDIVERASSLFDSIVIGIGQNQNKKYMFSIQQRMEWIQHTFSNFTNVSVKTYSGLTVSFCKQMGARYILRGIRNPSDFEFEKAIAHTNRNLDESIDTIFFLTASGKSFVSSSIVRDVIVNKGDYTRFVPDAVRINDF